MMKNTKLCSLVGLVLCAGSAAGTAHWQLRGAAAGPTTSAWIPGVGWVSISIMDPQPVAPPIGAGGALLSAAGTVAAPDPFSPFLGSGATWGKRADGSNMPAPYAVTFPLNQPFVTPAHQAATPATDTSIVQRPVDSRTEARQSVTGTVAVQSVSSANTTAGAPPRATPTAQPQGPNPAAEAAGVKAGSVTPGGGTGAGNKTGSSTNGAAKGLPTPAAPWAQQQGPRMLNASSAAPAAPGSSLAGSSATSKAQGRPSTAAANVTAPRAHGSMVAGAATAAARSGLTGPEPFLLRQPGAQQTLRIGCLLVRQQLQQGGTSLAHEAMKLSLRDNLPKIMPAFNTTLTCYETQCGEMSAVNAMQLLVEQGAEAVVSTTCSSDAVASVHIAAAAKIPLIAASASSPQLSGTPFFSRTVPSDRYGAAVDAKLARSMGLKNVGVVEEEDAFGQAVSFYFMAYLSAYGGLISEVHAFQPGKGDSQAAVADMLKGKATGLDGVYIATNDLAFLAGFLAAAAKSKLDVPIIAPGGAAASTELSAALKDNLGALKCLVTVAEGEGSQEYEAKLRAAVKNRTDLDTAGTGQAYDAVTALLKAYAAAPTPKIGADVAQLIPKQRFQGVTGPVAFDEFGDLVPHNSSYVKGTFSNKGKLVLGQFLPAPK